MSTVTAPRLNAPVPIFVADCGTKNAPNSEAERCANAAFIVRACNSHDELLCMLHRLLDEVCMTEEGMKLIAPLTLEQARAAIAKAEGRQE